MWRTQKNLLSSRRPLLSGFLRFFLLTVKLRNKATDDNKKRDHPEMNHAKKLPRQPTNTDPADMEEDMIMLSNTSMLKFRVVCRYANRGIGALFRHVAAGFYSKRHIFL